MNSSGTAIYEIPWRVRRSCRSSQICATVPIRRGSAIFFHDLALHGSCPNSSGQERWSAIATYRDASQQDDSTVWQTSVVLSGHSVNI